MKNSLIRIKWSMAFASAILAGAWTVLNAQVTSSKIPSYLSVGGNVSFQYAYDSQQNDDGSYTEVNTFQLKKARLDVKGGITEKMEFRVKAEFANTPKVLDAYIKYKFNKLVNLEMGQFKTPFTIENQYSSSNKEGIDKSIVISKLAGFSDIVGGTAGNSRDVGVMLYGTILESSDGAIPLISYNLGVFNGCGTNVKDDNLSKNIIGRLDFHPFMKELLLSGSVLQGKYNNGTDYNATNNRYAIGGEYKNDALSVRSEFIHTDIEGVGAWSKIEGFYVSAGYWFRLGESQKLSPVARFDRLDQDDVLTKQYLFGVDWWPDSHMRLLLNYTISDRQQFNKPENYVQAMVSVIF